MHPTNIHLKGCVCIAIYNIPHDLYSKVHGHVTIVHVHVLYSFVQKGVLVEQHIDNYYNCTSL